MGVYAWRQNGVVFQGRQAACRKMYENAKEAGWMMLDAWMMT